MIELMCSVDILGDPYQSHILKMIKIFPKKGDVRFVTQVGLLLVLIVM